MYDPPALLGSGYLMLVLGIESTCDETACAVVKDGQEILSSIVSSQIDLHQAYGGVVPELACRRHIDLIIPVIDQALSAAGVDLHAIDVIAAARGPGLVGALLIGLNTAKAIALALHKPLIGVNHVEAHLYASLMSNPVKVEFPCLGVVLSGGHTAICLMRSVGDYAMIGQTVDDAIGEAFDKAAKLMGLPYPGGPEIEKLAKRGDSARYPFKPCKVKGRPFDFSFSGLKTAVLYALKGQDSKHQPAPELTPQVKANVAASFQRAALEDIVQKVQLAAKEYGCNHLVLGGGVTNNKTLRLTLAEEAPHLICHWPGPGLSLDNAAMIAGLGYHRYRHQGKGDPLDVEVLTQMPL
jgi:N6-L-threonylcarbamoyladenine synthase